jgi:hypothetical protein
MVAKKCGQKSTIEHNMSSSEEYFEKVLKKHNGKYIYPIREYNGVRGYIDIICPIHGLFKQTAGHHLLHGCKRCASIEANTNLSLKEKIDICTLKHKGFYDYSLVCRPDNSRMKVIIICPIHGIFKQRLDVHLGGGECLACSYVKRGKSRHYSNEELLLAARDVHGDKYKYPAQDIGNTKSKIRIICPIHGEFLQIISDHIYNMCGCTNCSKWERKQENAWLDQLGIPRDSVHRQFPIRIPGKKYPFKADGFDPTTNTIYEFYGDFYHGNPKKYPNPNKPSGLGDATYGDLYVATIEREKLIKDAGYNLITIWESDFIALSRKNT